MATRWNRRWEAAVAKSISEIWGKKGKIHRYMYYVDVLKDDAEAAKLIVDSVREEYLKQSES